MKYYVYELADPRTDRVFYVGKGTGARIDQHEAEARSGRLSRKCDLIRDIWAAGRTVAKRKIKSFADEQQAYNFEADHINELGLRNLTNVFPGGGAARGVSALKQDRQWVRWASELLRITNGGSTGFIKILGHGFDLLPVIDDYKQRIAEIIDRRGLEWVNTTASLYKVQYTTNR